MSPHNAMGPLQIVAGSHVMMNTPNFYRLEHSTSFIEAYNRLTTEPMNFHGEEFSLSGKPGLGVGFRHGGFKLPPASGVEVRPLEELPTKSTKEKRYPRRGTKNDEGPLRGWRRLKGDPDPPGSAGVPPASYPCKRAPASPQPTHPARLNGVLRQGAPGHPEIPLVDNLAIDPVQAATLSAKTASARRKRSHGAFAG